MALLQALGVNAGLVVLGVLAVTPVVVAVDEGLSRTRRKAQAEAEVTAAVEWTGQSAARLS